MKPQIIVIDEPLKGFIVNGYHYLKSEKVEQYPWEE